MFAKSCRSIAESDLANVKVIFHQLRLATLQGGSHAATDVVGLGLIHQSEWKRLAV